MKINFLLTLIICLITTVMSSQHRQYKICVIPIEDCDTLEINYPKKSSKVDTVSYQKRILDSELKIHKLDSCIKKQESIIRDEQIKSYKNKYK